MNGSYENHVGATIGRPPDDLQKGRPTVDPTFTCN